MERRKSKRSTVAFLCACVWALVVLCLSLPARPAEKAHAVESSNDMITIYANALYSSDGEQFDEAEDFVWGKIFRGITILSQADWEYGSYNGTISEIKRFDYGDTDDDYTIGNIDGRENLAYLVENGYGAHVHDFTVDAGNKNWDSIDGNSHYAVCSYCGLLFQVAHRPGADGECKDCDYGPLDGDYINTYSFTIPDTFPNDDYAWATNENGTVATIEIPFEATISAGFTLNLYLQCSGVMTNDKGETISYEVAVDEDNTNHGVGEVFNREDPDAQIIWWYSPGDDEPLDDYNRAEITDGTIYITLTLDEVIYPGEYSDTLTFSVELIDDSEGY